MIKSILKSIFVLLIASSGLSTVQAQDIHYSQFYQAPLLLNPALTGHMPGKYRINAMYRRQWATISNKPVYETPSVAFDMNILRSENRYNSLGLGFSLMNDRSSGGILQTFNLMLSAAYHLDLTKKEKTYLSVGLQGGVMNKRLDIDEILFASQFNGEELDGSMASGEVFENSSIFNPDFRLGLVLAGFPTTKLRWKLGAGLFHLSQPSETFINETNKLPLRLVVHGDLRFSLGNSIALEPKILYQNQAKASELVGGLLLDLKITQKASFYLGGEYRLADAGIAIVGLRIADWDVGVSYDFNVSNLKAASEGRGALEFSLLKVFRSGYKVDPILPAIRYN